MTFRIVGIPAELSWDMEPTEWSIQADGALRVAVGPKTDWFIDPNGTFRIGNAPNALFTPPDVDFRFSARVTAALGATFDAGVLRVHVQDDVWAKLCFEYSPQGNPMIVSVVTRGTSDDCNSVIVDGDTVWLRIVRIGKTFAFHYSLDGRFWNLVRYFTLGDHPHCKVGFSCQSPTGNGCSAVFHHIRYEVGAPANLRSGE